jgi:hypothetical protein
LVFYSIIKYLIFSGLLYLLLLLLLDVVEEMTMTSVASLSSSPIGQWSLPKMLVEVENAASISALHVMWESISMLISRMRWNEHRREIVPDHGSQGWYIAHHDREKAVERGRVQRHQERAVLAAEERVTHLAHSPELGASSGRVLLETGRIGKKKMLTS